MASNLSWIRQFQLFLFDFDGLLVNTEELHFEAYRMMLRQRGFDLTWSMERFFGEAHFDSSALERAIYKEFPKLQKLEPRWQVLYSEKKAAYQEILKQGGLELMPGVLELLNALEKAKIKRCVVTNSTKEQVEFIQKTLPALRKIPHWITREQYQEPKPHPECYLKALSLHAAKNDRVIGFEDSLRGFHALQAAAVPGVLICPLTHPQLKRRECQGLIHFTSFTEIPNDFALA